MARKRPPESRVRTALPVPPGRWASVAPAALARTGLAIEQAVSLVTFAIGLA